jgi:hypothetical protein
VIFSGGELFLSTYKSEKFASHLCQPGIILHSLVGHQHAFNCRRGQKGGLLSLLPPERLMAIIISALGTGYYFGKREQPYHEI